MEANKLQFNLQLQWQFYSTIKLTIQSSFYILPNLKHTINCILNSITTIYNKFKLQFNYRNSIWAEARWQRLASKV
ncbi:hypothetical protein M0811_14466 [Anaeramoeba ignava]|uniref:Uncharacterized protein n=1 Tax=Anaeramoeba ignava TaxID=1746090 RepID=A0A9Q0LT97_ANAIG|nr:hypothetical protein M0811_14466 [Anaeramoeba ignava]